MRLLVLAWLLASGAWGIQLEPLKSNGAIFYRADERLPLRCLDAPALLGLPAAEQEALLDKAAAAGFNSVSFAAPAYGPSGFCKKLGAMDAERLGAFQALLGRMDARQLYAFPVLWNSEAVDSFARIGGGTDKFLTGRTQIQWQTWILRELVKSGGELSLSNTASVGAWILYRGPWPGPRRRGADSADSVAAQPFTAPVRGWLLWQLRALRQGGARQLSGAGFILKAELGEKAAADDPATSPAEPALPVAEIRQEETSVGSEAAMDKLPPLPGQESAGRTNTAEALSPWDLEGVDWDSVGRALREVPVSTGIDFMELTLDTEDWYRVGDTMGEAAERGMQAPLVWRHDWRTASRYERQKRLAAPEGLAGLIGPWPDNDWPEPGEAIWPAQEKGKAPKKALLFKYLEVLSEDGKPVLALHLNLPGEVELHWDRKWPASKLSASKDPALVNKLALRGAKWGENVLFYAKARSKKWGSAALRSRWVKLAKPAAKTGKGVKAKKA